MGFFLSGKNKYSKTFKFQDINYAVASRNDKEMMFLEYSELLNFFDSFALPYGMVVSAPPPYLTNTTIGGSFKKTFAHTLS